ncbi:MFS multidrug transporter [Sporothrix schenckii 1099-18]|uniref:MFS multidrug transporter n=1 Tax=Sporothrix schenckii 1099-18 TaxID=1397361 RepID=A0A0F2LV49_SPOSC|nr:MFS multidrug transporter [Sporothrix schenckii 1099-18]KJR81338.1 MFS multidrug transporter [Sporothrix schenckii 1099-18]
MAQVITNGRQTGSEIDPLLPAAASGQRTIGYSNGFSNGFSNGSSSSSTTGVPGDTANATDNDDAASRSSARRRLSDASSAANSHLLTPGRTYAIVFSMWVLIFLQASNVSGMTMAQSAVAADLNAYEHAMWFTSAYLISSASFAPVIGRLATVFAPSHLIAASSLCFAVGAVVTAYAQSLLIFLLGRAIVGLGAAGTMSLTLIAVLQFTSRRRRGLFVGLANAGFTIGLSSGAIVYGALQAAMGWRMLFLMQAPFALLAGVGILLSMPKLGARELGGGATAVDKHGRELTVWQKLARIDYLGAALLALTILLFLYGLSGTVHPKYILLSGVSLLLFVATEVWYVPRVTGGDPIVPVEVLRSRGVLFSCLAQLGVMSARWTVLYYAPIYVLAVRGFSAATSGSALIPTNVGFGIGGLVIGWLHVRRSGAFWLPSVVSLFLFAGTLAVVGLLSRADASGLGTAAYVLALFANGFCTGAYLNYTLAHVLHLTRPSTHFIITSLLATFRGFAGSFGTSIGGGFFMRRLAIQLTDGFTQLDGGNLSSARRTLITQLVGSPALVFGNDRQGHAVLNDAERRVAVSGYESALGELYRWGAIVALVVILVQAGTGWTAPKPLPAVDAAEGSAVFSDEDEEEEILEAFAEHDTTMEA